MAGMVLENKAAKNINNKNCSIATGFDQAERLQSRDIVLLLHIVLSSVLLAFAPGRGLVELSCRRARLGLAQTAALPEGKCAPCFRVVCEWE